MADDLDYAVEPDRFADQPVEYMGDTQTQVRDTTVGTGHQDFRDRDLQRAQQRQEENANVDSRFFPTVSAIAQRYSEKDQTGSPVLPLASNDITKMSSQFLLGKKYLNPTAYVLGYYVSSGGTDMEPENVKTRLREITTKIFPEQPPEVGVTEADVIRYARFWKLLTG